MVAVMVMTSLVIWIHGNLVVGVVVAVMSGLVIWIHVMWSLVIASLEIWLLS